MKVLKVEVFSYDELSDTAKEVAILRYVIENGLGIKVQEHRLSHEANQ